jgi:hypothetical protein
VPILNMQADIEEIVEREIERVAVAARGGDRCLWFAGVLAARIVGKYHINATKDIALKVGRSDSTVENWAHAADIANWLREAGYSAEVKYFRTVFTPTHFWRMWDLRNKYNLQSTKVMHYFQLLLQFKIDGQHYGSGVLERIVEAGESKNGSVPVFAYYLPRFRNVVVGMLAASDLDPEFLSWWNRCPKSFKEKLSNGQRY